MLSIDYTGFIPILVDAIQNLQSTVETQAATIEALQNKDHEAVPGKGKGRPACTSTPSSPTASRSTRSE